MNKNFSEDYQRIRGNGEIGFYEQKRGLIAVWGKEAVQFLNGLITNDVAKLEDGAQMSAAFPNAQGRLLAYVRVLRRGERFLFETEEVTREKVFQNLFRFTFAGDFFVEDLSDNYSYFEVFNSDLISQNSDSITYKGGFGASHFVTKTVSDLFKSELEKENCIEVTDGLYEVLRIENGLPLYGVDMDETTVVLETGLDEAVSFKKGCYIGQEIIARIHFRGHVAKKLTGLVFEGENAAVKPNDEIKSPEGKNAGRITSVVFSPKLEKTIALAYVRYEFLAEATELKVNDVASARVKDLPIID